MHEVNPAQVIADDTPVLEAVLMCDGERTELMREEARLLAQLNGDEAAAGPTADGKALNDTEATARLEQVGRMPRCRYYLHVFPGGQAPQRD